MAEEQKSKDIEVMDPKWFLDHTTRMHILRKRLNDIFDAEQHWAFAMTPACHGTVMQLANLHLERCGYPIGVIPVCCLANHPAFLLFPKEYLAYDEIEELIEIKLTWTQEQAEKMTFFAIDMQDPQALSDALNVWIKMDHLTS